jgi:hypothetical protein
MVLGAVLAACAAQPAPVERAVPPKPEIATSRKIGSTTREVYYPRFDLDIESWVPDSSDALRWPLSTNSHPQLQPGYAIAASLAQPSVTWVELCNLGAHKRRLAGAKQDPVAYLAAWCHVLAHDVDAVIAELVPLQRSMVHGIARTIYIDIANILVSGADAGQSLRVLAKHRLSDPTLFDVLAATYAELGKLDDAREINARALESNVYASTETKCHRLARDVALGEPQSLDNLRTLAEGNAECESLYTPLLCTEFPTDPRCSRYYAERGVSKGALLMLAAYQAWPTQPAPPNVWLVLAWQARMAIPYEDADMAAMAAIETALRGSACGSPSVKEAQDVARELQRTRGVERDVDARLATVLAKPETLCWKP